MKIKRILALALMLSMFMCMFAMPANAATYVIDENIEIEIVNDELSEEMKAQIIAYYMNGEEESESTTYGLTCDLLGHKYESSIVYVTTHKVYSSDPRCVRRQLNHEICSRCDDEVVTMISQWRISCC